MNRIGDYFLRAKHWQLFGLFSLLFCALAVTDIPEIPGVTAFTAVAVLFQFCLVAWLWSMGAFLSSVVPPALRSNGRFFRFAVVYPPLYAAVAWIVFSMSLPPEWLILILLPHLFAMFCIFYSFHFVARSLVVAETGRPASVDKCIGLCFLLLLFPIGVWIVQPRVNLLYGVGGRQPAL
jgi:hypothetical protein